MAAHVLDHVTYFGGNISKHRILPMIVQIVHLQIGMQLVNTGSTHNFMACTSLDGDGFPLHWIVTATLGHQNSGPNSASDFREKKYVTF